MLKKVRIRKSVVRYTINGRIRCAVLIKTAHLVKTI